MKNYLFNTIATMKPHNVNKFWIDSDIIGTFETTAESVADALQQFVDHVNGGYVEISKSAIKNKKPMYFDTETGAKQCGYVLTGAADFEKENGGYVKQFIDLWLSISVIESAF